MIKCVVYENSFKELKRFNVLDFLKRSRVFRNISIPAF